MKSFLPHNNPTLLLRIIKCWYTKEYLKAPKNKGMDPEDFKKAFDEMINDDLKKRFK